MVGFNVASREFHNRAVTFNQIVVERTRNFVDATNTHSDHVVGVCVAVGGGVVYDYAEGFDVSQRHKIDPGTVVIIDPDNPGKLAVSNSAHPFEAL